MKRDTENGIVGGVCAGIANWIGIDPIFIRLLWLLTGPGLFLYIMLWILIPEEELY